MGHPIAFEFADRLSEIAPKGVGHVFYTNSGSESVETALKMAIAYHRARGQGHRTKIVGREKGYHGVGFGGMSVGGIGGNRKQFGAMLPYVDHLPHTQPPAGVFHRGMPPADGPHGAVLAAPVYASSVLAIPLMLDRPVGATAGQIGNIRLESRELAEAGHYPAIDVLASASRVSKATMNVSVAVNAVSPKSSLASSGSTVRS